MSEFPGLEQLRACDEELNDLITTGVDAFKSDASQKNLPARTEVRKTAPQAASTPSLDELRTMASEGDLSAGDIQQMVSDGEITAQDAAAIHAVEPAMGVSDLLDEALRDIEAA